MSTRRVKEMDNAFTGHALHYCGLGDRGNRVATTSASPVKLRGSPVILGGLCRIYSVSLLVCLGVHEVLSVMPPLYIVFFFKIHPLLFAVRKTQNAVVEAFLLACTSVSRPVRHPIEFVLCWVVLWWYKSRRRWDKWCTWCISSELSEQYLLSVFTKPAHSSEVVARTVALSMLCRRRVIGNYVVIGLLEPWLVFCGSDTVSAHGVAPRVRSSASFPPAVERVAIGCERVVLRSNCEVCGIVCPVRTRINVVESASLLACCKSGSVPDLEWCVERHVYIRQQSDGQMIRNSTYSCKIVRTSWFNISCK